MSKAHKLAANEPMTTATQTYRGGELGLSVSLKETFLQKPQRVESFRGVATLKDSLLRYKHEQYSQRGVHYDNINTAET